MRVAIVGAGVAGIVNARVLKPLGVDVVVYEARSDLGGVWSDTRGYPGQRLQNDKRTYVLSDLPMPADYPEHPDRAQVHAYLEGYVRHHGIGDVFRFSTTVTAAAFDAREGRWRITLDGPDGIAEDAADWLIIANGTLSTPNKPVLAGADDFVRAGGRIVDAADLGEDADALRGLRLVLLGYGKSATDIAVAAAGRAKAVTVLARSVPWKLPERIGRFSFQHVVISRLGEHLLWGPYRSLGGHALRRLDTGFRVAFRTALARRLRRQLQLDRRGTLPTVSVQELSHLITPGFDRAVDDGLVDLRAGVHVTRLTGGDGGPAVELDDGSTIPADVLVAATGYRTDIAFLDDRTRALLLDDAGRMPLHRHALPLRAPHLLFAGWINSFRSPIADELQALWIAGFLLGAVRTPRAGRRFEGNAHNAAPTGHTIIDQDAWLADLGFRMPASVFLAELVHPIDPAAYAGLHARLRDRVGPVRDALPGSSAGATTTVDTAPVGILMHPLRTLRRRSPAAAQPEPEEAAADLAGVDRFA